MAKFLKFYHKFIAVSQFRDSFDSDKLNDLRVSWDSYVKYEY